MNGLEIETADLLVVDRQNAATEEAKAVMRAFGLRGHPSFAIVTPSGVLSWSYSGFISEESLREQLMQASMQAKE